MSEIKIQESPAPEQGAQADVLSPDAAAGRTRGTDQDQNTLSFSRGSEVNFAAAPSRVSPLAPNGQDGETAPSNSPLLSVAGVGVSVAQVGHKALEGSNGPNDFRKSGDAAAVSLAAASGSSKGPRDAVQQAR